MTTEGEMRAAQERCPACGRFLKWDSVLRRYARHVVYDGYAGGYEWTC